jgi:pyruvate dehydrogenase E1 component
MDAERHATLNPTAASKTSWVQRCLGAFDTPVVTATDFVRAVAEQVRPYVPGPYRTLGTDGYGRSDTRPVLRFFEVDRHSIVVAALASLGDRAATRAAVDRYGLDTIAPPPWRRDGRPAGAGSDCRPRRRELS